MKHTYTLSNIDEAAAALWRECRSYPVITLSGGLGAGKTTLVSHLCHTLGITDAVSSPTFALVNEYRLQLEGKELPVFHMDWYRLKNVDEAIDAGMEDHLEQARSGDAICIVEWPEKAARLLRPPYAAVTIDILGDEERELSIQLVDHP
ncbi:tRNA (adenosine(37)-N6)-threonylcarbamoyltransferase complex ATPase subunit type 1 TsaE [Nemorincola caseinilytica]|uniref:tRNA threonylcarbamoyladenosine biosynthesis protein TsaE n=1 Tax=Nemorincola caseinilytica TaxID=2054315 RepID=A0ABP8NID9_9BACT